MTKKYLSEEKILKVVRAFETGTISRSDWGHAEHLLVANHYLSESDFDTAYDKMRAGIFNLLRSFNVDLTKEMPYHETLTIFWMRSVDDFRKANKNLPFLETCHGLIEKFDKDYPLKFYSRELLFSDEARRRFVEGDLQEH